MTDDLEQTSPVEEEPSAPTVADNIWSMARLTADIKKVTRLSETTILRIIDMNLAIASSRLMPDFPVVPEDDEVTEEDTNDQ